MSGDAMGLSWETIDQWRIDRTRSRIRSWRLVSISELCRESFGHDFIANGWNVFRIGRRPAEPPLARAGILSIERAP
jgi:hypothetical protein